MKTRRINYIIDVGLLASFTVTGLSGVILFFSPRGPHSGVFSILSLYKATWISLHEKIGLLMVFLMLVHAALHFNWYVSTTKQYLKELK
ncbi:MAG: DUF4405 domain-containing protein [archaeon]